jgi:hypothetical protein
MPRNLGGDLSRRRPRTETAAQRAQRVAQAEAYAAPLVADAAEALAVAEHKLAEAVRALETARAWGHTGDLRRELYLLGHQGDPECGTPADRLRWVHGRLAGEAA